MNACRTSCDLRLLRKHILSCHVDPLLTTLHINVPWIYLSIVRCDNDTPSSRKIMMHHPITSSHHSPDPVIRPSGCYFMLGSELLPCRYVEKEGWLIRRPASRDDARLFDGNASTRNKMLQQSHLPFTSTMLHVIGNVLLVCSIFWSADWQWSAYQHISTSSSSSSSSQKGWLQVK